MSCFLLEIIHQAALRVEYFRNTFFVSSHSYLEVCGCECECEHSQCDALIFALTFAVRALTLLPTAFYYEKVG